MSLEELPVIYTAVPLSDDTEGSSNNETSNRPSTKITFIHTMHFLIGCLIGNGHSVLGFKRLYYHFNGMSTTHVLLYSIIWSLITSLSGYLIYNLAWTLISHRAEKCRSLQKYCKPHLLLQYEYATYLGIFLGFCLGCTAADVVYGMPWTCIAATVLMALAWAAVMIWCAYQESSHSGLGTKDGTILPFLVV